MSRQAKVSVIVPVYKVEDYLDKCVTSIVRQTYTDIEIILVDDGSPDNCGRMCDAWRSKDSRIRVIHKENGGLSSARNFGINAAKGKYILFVDSDDWIDPVMIDTLHRLCVSRGAEIAECSYRNLYNGSVIEETACSGKIVEATPLEAIEGNLDWKLFKPVAWNKLYSRDIVGSIRFPLGKLHEDEFTTHKYYLAAKKIVYADVSMYNYNRMRENSITAVFRPANMDSCEAFNEKAHLVWSRPDLSPIMLKMDNSYCYVLFEHLMQCVQANYEGPEVQKAVKDALADFETMKEHGISDIYVKCFELLKNEGIAATAMAWRKSRGLD